MVKAGTGPSVCFSPAAYCPDDSVSLQTNFPAGLVQPEGSYRFASDALLLGAYAAQIMAARRVKMMRGYPHVAELGSGCGACLLAFALLLPEAACIGLDCEPELVNAANANARNLKLQNRVAFILSDVAKDNPALGRHFQLVMANPPWNRPGSGRLPKGRLRQKALFQTPGILNAFCNYARLILQDGGYFCLILPPAMLCDFCACIEGIGLRQILPVCSHAGKPASRLLLQARKGANSDPQMLAPLILHEQAGWSAAALELCPWLGKAVL